MTDIVGRGVLPLSGLIRQAGAQPLPLPGPLYRAALKTMTSLGGPGFPAALLDYMHYGWVANGERAEEELGRRADLARGAHGSQGGQRHRGHGSHSGRATRDAGTGPGRGTRSRRGAA